MTVRKAARRCLYLLTPRDRRKLLLATLAQVSTSALDLVGVLLLGLVGTLAVTTVQGLPPVPAVQGISDRFNLGSLSSSELLILFSVVAAALLLIKSMLSTYLVRRVFQFLASRQAVVSGRLARNLLERPLTFVQGRSSQETAFALVQGAGNATLVLLGQCVVFVSELSLLLILGGFLLLVSPLVAISSILFFTVVAALLQLALGDWAHRAGLSVAASDISSLETTQEALNAYREITVSNRRGHYAERIQALRWQAANSAADIQFISSLPKYVFEIALVIGGFALAGALFATQDSVAAVGTLALFLAAATRVMPSILRLQSASLTMRNAAGFASSTLDLADELAFTATNTQPRPRFSSAMHAAFDDHVDFVPEITIRNVTFAYPGNSSPAVRRVSLYVPSGTSMALVGASGAGKSTLADLILGVLHPQEGQVLVGGVSPSQATEKWPGGIAYVPQEVTIAKSSIRMNVALGLPEDSISDELVWAALKRVHLHDLVSRSPNGLYSPIGERGMNLSGGQRQRLGIARALYTNPRLLMLDEATSSLDAETEEAISQTIKQLEGVVTVVVIAHRLSTVRFVDQVVYLERGDVLAQGSFDDVRREVPAFDRQAVLMGLGQRDPDGMNGPVSK